MTNGRDETPDERIHLDQIPPPDADWDQISAFALTFDGYQAHGSFETCAELANTVADEYSQVGCLSEDLSLRTLRTCLFFEQRRWRHYGEAPDSEAMKYIRELVNALTQRCAQ